jgi:large subunit ribosomal protein L29
VRAKDLRDLNLEELAVKTDEFRAALFNARIRKETGQLENTAKLRLLRRDIARAETLLREKRGAGE